MDKIFVAVSTYKPLPSKCNPAILVVEEATRSPEETADQKHQQMLDTARRVVEFLMNSHTEEEFGLIWENRERLHFMQRN